MYTFNGKLSYALLLFKKVVNNVTTQNAGQHLLSHMATRYQICWGRINKPGDVGRSMCLNIRI